MTLQSGTPALTFDGGRYRVLRALGQGGMGVVYACEDSGLQRLVAIKTLVVDTEVAGPLVELFLQEGRALALLDHPCLVRVLDAREEEQGGRRIPYLVMELVEGEPMDVFLDATRRPDLPTGLRWVAQVADALAYCHGRGVVHRDVKPGNVLVRPGGGVKLIDFGLARPLEQLAQRSTQVRGTPIYMAPETVTGGTPGPATDVYALGVTIYEIVSGAPPFIEGEMLFHHIYSTPPPLSSRCPVPPALEELALRCLAKDPLGRPTAQELAEALRRVADALDGLGGEVPVPYGEPAIDGDRATSPTEPDLIAAAARPLVEAAPAEAAVAQEPVVGSALARALRAALLGAGLAALLLVPLAWYRARREAAPVPAAATSAAVPAAVAPAVPAAVAPAVPAAVAPATDQAASDLTPAPDLAPPDAAHAPPPAARPRPRPRPRPAAAPSSVSRPAEEPVSAPTPTAEPAEPEVPAAPKPDPPPPAPAAAPAAPRPDKAAPAAPRPAPPPTKPPTAAPLSF